MNGANNRIVVISVHHSHTSSQIDGIGGKNFHLPCFICLFVSQ